MKCKSVRETWSTKTPVVALLERGGEVRFRVMERVTARNLDAALANVDATARLMTDESSFYTLPGQKFAGHETVHHKSGEHARGDVTTNTVEGVFSLLKRGMYGTFHSVSKRQFRRYCAELAFRYNTRGMAEAPDVSASPGLGRLKPPRRCVDVLTRGDC